MKITTRILAFTLAGQLPLALAQSPPQDPTAEVDDVELQAADVDLEAADADLEVGDLDPEDVETGIAGASSVAPDVSGVDSPISQRVAAAAGLTKLQTAIAAANLEGDLDADGPYTLFAPTDSAFDKLGEANLENLLKPENRSRLSTLLKRHLVSGEIKAAELETGELTTAAGDKIFITVAGSNIKVGQANVTMADYPAGNGVIHMIDQVLAGDSAHAGASAESGVSTDTEPAGDRTNESGTLPDNR